MNTFSTWLAAFMLALFSTMVIMAIQFPEGARFMPLIIGVPGILLCLFQLALDAMKAPGGRFATYRFRTAPKAGKPTEAVAAVVAEEEFGPETVPAEVMMLTYFVSFVSAVLLFGFYLSVPVMLVTFLKREAAASWRLALLLAGGATLVMYLMFGLLLHMRLHPGFITPVVMRSLGL